MNRSTRSGSVLATSVVMVAVILAVAVGMISYFESANRRARSERWGAVADDAARSGLAMMLGWARAHVDKYRTTPPEWDTTDGDIVDALPSFRASQFFNTRLPTGALPSVTLAGVGTLGAPPKPGDIIQPGLNPLVPNDLGEYVVGVYGQYVASFKVRLQSFSVNEHTARMYKIGVAGRVRQLGAGPAGSKLVADRVQLATVGRLPLSRYAALIDVDMTRNWVPGETIEGPVHVNRGYVDAPLGQKPANVSKDLGRSTMRLMTPGVFAVPAGSKPNPVFTDVVSLTRRADGLYPDDANNGNFFKINTAGTDEAEDGPSYTDALSRSIYLAPDNQALIASKAGPEFVPDPVALPLNSRNRLATALGLPNGVQLTDLNWFPKLPNGVYLPDTLMVANTAAGATYSPGAQAAGGIYVRGTVEIMRLACDAVHSYYAFQMGEMAATGKHRVYIVDVDRSARKLKLVAYPPGQTLRQLATANGNSYAAMVALAAAVTVVDPLAYGVNVPGMAAIAQAAAPPNLYPFNGIVFVDYAQNDPCRLALGSPNVHGPGDGPGTKPLSGHILALGDPGDPAGAGNPAAKQTIAPAPTALAPFLRTAEVVSSEDMTSGGTPRKASRLNIISSGSIFIQNHVLVSSIANKIDTTSLVTSLRRDNLRLQDTHDVLGLVADHQIVVGLCAPNGATRTDPGLVVTATMAALGDPQYDVESNSIPDIPTFGTPAYQAYALRGSFGVESVITLLTLGLNEPYDIGTPNAAGGFDTYTGPAPATYPTNPLYDRRGGGGTEWGFPALLDPLNNPNGLSLTRGRLMVFGSLVLKKRGAVGLGNASYDKDYRYDQRLLSLSPPLFPNSVNLVTFISKIGAAGFPPYTSGPMAAELAILN